MLTLHKIKSFLYPGLKVTHMRKASRLSPILEEPGDKANNMQVHIKSNGHATQSISISSGEVFMHKRHTNTMLTMVPRTGEHVVGCELEVKVLST